MYPGTNHISIMSDFFERFLTNMRPHAEAMDDIVVFIGRVLEGRERSSMPLPLKSGELQ